MDLLVYAFLLTLVVVVFIVLIHLNFKVALYHVNEASSQAIHAHDDAAARIADHQKWYTSHIMALTRWGEALSKSHAEMAVQLRTSANREVSEVQRYMEVVRQDLIEAVGNAAKQRPHVNPTAIAARRPPEPAAGTS